MNADKLYKTAQIIKAEIDATQSLANLGNVINSLSTLVSNPHPQHISQFNQFVVNFRSGFQSTKYDSLGSADKQLIEELAVSDLIGASLLEKIDFILQANSITHQIAFSEITPIHQRLNELYSGVTQLIQGFSILKISADTNKTEFAALIPRKFTNENLDSLGKELKELNFILRPFYELNGATQDDIKVNTIASSDYTVYIALIPSVAISISKAVDKILEWFEKLIAIKKSLQELRNNDVKAELIEPIIKNKQLEIDTMIAELAEKLTSENPSLDPHRKNEIRNALTKAIKKMAERIDNGFAYDLNVADEDLNSQSEEQTEVWAEVKKVASKLRISAIEGQGILQISYDESEVVEKHGKRSTK